MLFKNTFLLIIFVIICVVICSGCGKEYIENDDRSLFIDIRESSLSDEVSDEEQLAYGAADFTVEGEEIDQKPLSQEEYGYVVVDFDTYFTMENIEEHIFGGYEYSVYSGYWLGEQGESIVPYLDGLLENDDNYNRHFGNFPQNIFWALGRIGGDKAEAVLLKHVDGFESAQLALKGLRARKYGYDTDRIGVIMITKDIYAEPNLDSEIIGTALTGDLVFLLEPYIKNGNEVGPRGGCTVYDYFEMAESGIKGYIMRYGHDFMSVY